MRVKLEVYDKKEGNLLSNTDTGYAVTGKGELLLWIEDGDHSHWAPPYEEDRYEVAGVWVVDDK